MNERVRLPHDNHGISTRNECFKIIYSYLHQHQKKNYHRHIKLPYQSKMRVKILKNMRAKNVRIN